MTVFIVVSGLEEPREEGREEVRSAADARAVALACRVEVEEEE